MYNYTEQVSSQLNRLLDKNYDAQKGYLTASENASSSVLTSLFETKSNERKKFGEELKSEIKTFGGNPNQSGSIQGTAHRAWMNTKAFFSSNNDESMLEESIRGEKAAVEEYNEILNSKGHLPKSTTDILKSQRDSFISSTVLIRRLEDLK